MREHHNNYNSPSYKPEHPNPNHPYNPNPIQPNSSRISTEASTPPSWPALSPRQTKTEGSCTNLHFAIQILICSMWKVVGSVHTGDDKSVRSNRSRDQINAEPFHQSLKRKSNISPEGNRSFCQDYFQKRKNNAHNMTSLSNKSEKDLRALPSRDDLFTELRNKASKVQQTSRMDSLRENPQSRPAKKGIEDLKKTVFRLHTLKKEQIKLRKNLENEFDQFKNYFYQMEQKLHAKQAEAAEDSSSGAQANEDLLKGLLGKAFQVQKYFGEMDRKKTLIMQKLLG